MKILAIALFAAATVAVSAQTASKPHDEGYSDGPYYYSTPFGCDAKSDECASQKVMHKINVLVSPPMVFLSNCAFEKCSPSIKRKTGADWARSDFEDYCSKHKAYFKWTSCYVFQFTDNEAGKPSKWFTIDGKGVIRRHGVSLHDALLIVASNALWSATSLTQSQPSSTTPIGKTGER